MKSFGLGVAFVLEIIAFISFASLGLLFPVGHILQILLSVFLFVVLIIFWSVFMAPKAPQKLKLVPYYISKFIIYSLAAVYIFERQKPIIGVLFVIAALIDEKVLFEHNTSR